MGFRPESLRFSEDGISIVVDVVEELGSDAYLYGRLPGRDGDPLLAADVVARIDPKVIPPVASSVTMEIDAAALHVFSATTGERLD